MIREDGAITIVEWPGIMEELLPEDTIKIYFEYVDENNRKVRLEEHV